MEEIYSNGLCLNCGTYFEHVFDINEFDKNNFCSKKCQDEFEKYLSEEMKINP